MAIIDSLRTSINKWLNPTPVAPLGGGGWRTIHEPFAGAWQRGVSELKMGDVSSYSTVYACISRITKDIGKLPFRLVQRDENGLWNETRNPAYSPLLRTPNHYQTPAQFREEWISSKLLHGNTYVLKRRDRRGVVDGLYVLDPTKVTPMVAESGGIMYRISYGTANTMIPGLGADQVTVPAREIIHDRELSLFHPLIGIPPLVAAYLAATKNIRIQNNESEFFANGAQPSGILTSPAGMSDEDADKLTALWQKNFAGSNRGRIAVLGADMKYQAFTAANRDSQLVEQLKYSDEQICHAFGIPPYKVQIGSIPAGLKVDDLNQMYYSDALQARIESLEDCLDEGLGLEDDWIGVELNLEPLLRMDAQKQAEVEGALVSSGIKAPNEARRRFGLKPLAGGDSVYLQQQNFSLEALARRDASPDPFASGEARGMDRQRTLLTPGQANFFRKIVDRKDKFRMRFNNDTQRWESCMEGSDVWNPSSWRWTPELEEKWAKAA